MKLCVICAAFTLALCLKANSSPIVNTSGAARPVARMVDDPPPEPVECPMCGGNAQLHARRLIALQKHDDMLALFATRW